MNDTDRKFATVEILKECWCEDAEFDGFNEGMCKHGHIMRGPRRTFTTPDDAYALEQAIDRAQPLAFDLYCMGRGIRHLLEYRRLDAEQRCQLIIDFYKERAK